MKVIFQKLFHDLVPHNLHELRCATIRVCDRLLEINPFIPRVYKIVHFWSIESFWSFERVAFRIFFVKRI